MEACPAEVRPAEVRPAEVRSAEVRPAEVRPGEFRPGEIRLGEVRLKILMRLTPVVPLRDTLVSEDSDLFGVGHFQLSTELYTLSILTPRIGKTSPSHDNLNR